MQSPHFSIGQTHNGPDIIWLEHDGYLSGWVRGIKGDPSVYLRAMQIHTWSIRSPAWHWTAIDVNYEHSLLYMFDRYDRSVTMPCQNWQRYWCICQLLPMRQPDQTSDMLTNFKMIFLHI